MDTKTAPADHATTSGESYFRHMTGGLCAGVRMIGAGLCCIVNAFVPALFAGPAAGGTRRAGFARPSVGASGYHRREPHLGR